MAITKTTPALLEARVMHHRLTPKANQFSYGLYYFMLPLNRLQDSSFTQLIGLNSRSLVSFHSNDYGNGETTDLEAWIRSMLAPYGLSNNIANVVLLTMPRVIMVSFNPVSFWLCLDADEQLIAVLCEVNNTFGERHYYLCHNIDGRLISEHDSLECDKEFYVSPFLPRQGQYSFRFNWHNDHLKININYTDGSGKTLLTSLSGQPKLLTKKTILYAFWRHPFVTAKVISMIHWQALKLLIKGVPLQPRPKALDKKLTLTTTTRRAL
jgi:DUF1365 family protein